MFSHVWFENSFQLLTYLFLHLLPLLSLLCVVCMFFLSQAVFLISFYVVWIHLFQVNFIYTVPVTSRWIVYSNQSQNSLITRRNREQARLRGGGVGGGLLLMIFTSHTCVPLSPPLMWYTCVHPTTLSLSVYLPVWDPCNFSFRSWVYWLGFYQSSDPLWFLQTTGEFQK